MARKILNLSTPTGLPGKSQVSDARYSVVRVSTVGVGEAEGNLLLLCASHVAEVRGGRKEIRPAERKGPMVKGSPYLL